MTNLKMILEIKEGVGYITFNNPEKHNAVSLEMWEQLGKMINELEKDKNIKVVVLKGAGGKSFVSGADISKFDKDRSTKVQVSNYNKKTSEIYARIENFPKPTIAMIEGYCIGGGLNLAVCCDIRICSEKSLFAMPAAKLSLGYPFTSIKRLFDIMKPGMSKHLMFSADKINSHEALSCGLIQKVVKDHELENFVNKYESWIKEICDFLPSEFNMFSFLESMKPQYEKKISLDKDVFYSDPLDYIAKYNIKYGKHKRSGGPGEYRNFFTPKQIKELKTNFFDKSPLIRRIYENQF